MSFFNSGDHQTFTVHSLIAQQEASRSETLRDWGENKLHYVHLQNLQPSTHYVFYVVAQNKYGNSSSEMVSCITLPGKWLKNVNLTINLFYIELHNLCTYYNCDSW